MHPEVLRDHMGKCPVCEMPLEQIPGQASAAVGSVVPAATAAPARYFCAMKCEGDKTYDQPGNCPVCSMKLELVPAALTDSGTGLLAVPASAVLDSGTRRIVYVEKTRGLFEAREVVLGPRAAGFFPVITGLAEGERVATRGGFLIDSQFQITGHPSLFYPGGLLGSSASPTNAATPSGEVLQHQH
jgi:hypothetical protein